MGAKQSQKKRKPNDRIKNKAPKEFVHSVVVNGEDIYGELGGIIQNSATLKLAANIYPSDDITQIYSGHNYSFYCNDNFTKIIAAGCNKYGQLGIDKCAKSQTKRKNVTFFNKNKIKIKNICVNHVLDSSATFWMTDNNIIYGNGHNTQRQLGIGDTINRYIPTRIDALCYPLKCIDIKSNLEYTIALISNQDTIYIIINYWFRIFYIRDIGQDAANQIYKFCQGIPNHVYCTTSKFSKTFSLHRDYLWYTIDTLQDANIIKIASGWKHSTVLDDNGNVWCFGDNEDNQCDVISYRENKIINEPVKVEYFVKNNIKIIDIACGNYNNFAVDDKRNLYSWGRGPGYLWWGNSEYLIRDKQDVKQIKCGGYHTYFETIDGKHYLFGRNYNGQCLVNMRRDQIEKKEAVCINHIVEKKTGKQIKEDWQTNKRCSFRI